MGLEEEYPKSNQKTSNALRALLARGANLDAKEWDFITLAINDMANKARDLDEIHNRLLRPGLSPQEVGELVIALQLTAEAISVNTDALEDRLYEIGDALKAQAPTAPVPQ
jgi:hypothetical protein